MITYSIISILSLSLCYFIYLAFVKTKNHQFSRFFLLLILVGGLSAPLLPISNLFESNLPPINFDFNAEEIFAEHSGEWKSAASNDLGSEKTLIPSEENKPNSLNILSIIFGLITTIFILRFTWNLSLIYRKVKVLALTISLATRNSAKLQCWRLTPIWLFTFTSRFATVFVTTAVATK